MAKGQALYVDVWEQRPPGIYLTYLAAFSIFGWTESAIAWLDIVAASVVTLLLWQLGRRLADDLAGALAAALFAGLTIPAGLYGYGGFLERSVCETFIVACVGGAALALARLGNTQAPRLAVVAGLLGGLAAVYKPNAAVYLPVLGLWWALQLPPGPGRWRHAATYAAWMATAAGAVLGATLLWIWSIGAVAEARTAIVDFNRYYVATGLATAEHLLAFAHAIGLRFKTEPIWTGGVLASIAASVVLIRTRTLSPLPALALAWGAGSVLVILVNGIRLFNSYFLQAYAPLCLMLAWGLAAPSARSLGLRLARGALLIAMGMALIRGSYVTRAADRTATDWRHLVGSIDRDAYLEAFGGYANERGYSARANQELADYIAAQTAPSDAVFLFGVNGAGVYFLADRVTAHRFLRVNFFYPDGFPDPRFTLGAVTAELAQRRPRFLIFENLHARSDIGRAVSGVIREPSVEALLGDYVLDTRIEDFTLYRRR